MLLGLGLESWSSRTAALDLELVRRAESLGFDSVWTAEAYGADALTPLAYLAGATSRIKLATGLIQVAARPATTAAMSLATIDRLAGGGRVIAGVGLSNPQLVEGWYGQPWGRPLTRLREYVAIVRQCLDRTAPVTLTGDEIELPYRGLGSSGLGKALKPILVAAAPIPLLLAGGGPRAVALAAEVGDGWLPMGFHPGSMASYRDALDDGFQRRPGATAPSDFRIQAICGVVLTDDVAGTIDSMKASVAMYVGGMGAPGRNFHQEQMARCGFAEESVTVHELYVAGRRDEAAKAVPDEYLDRTRLIGSRQRIAQRWPAWERSGATGLTIYPNDPGVLDLFAELSGSRDRA